MSAAAASAKLHSPLQELVTGVADAHHGKSEKDKTEVSEWIEKVAAGKVAKSDSLKVRLIVCDP
jgi:aminoacyl tRNA synthase complex-interacting multifunctional protein 1